MRHSATRPRRFTIVATFVALAILTLQFAASPRIVGAQSGDFEVMASGLSNPRGLAFGPDGSLYVAEAGRGGEHVVNAGYDQVPYNIGTTAKVTRIAWNGRLMTILPHLPSVEARGDIYGAAGVAFIGDTLYVLTAA